MEEKHIVEAFYQKVNEEERLADRQGHVEYMTTMSYIRKYLKPHMQIAEIGAGTGRYSLALAREGHHVEAVELVEHNIQVFRSKLEKKMIFISYREMRWNFPVLQMKAWISRCCLDRCIIFLQTSTEKGRSRKRCGLPKRAAFCSLPIA